VFLAKPHNAGQRCRMIQSYGIFNGTKE
jgi:hypothetical protein